MSHDPYEILISQFISMVSKDRAKILALEQELAALKLELKKMQEIDRTVVIPRPAGAYRIRETE